MDNNVILYIIIAALMIIFVVDMVLNYRQAQAAAQAHNQQTVDLQAVYVKTIQDLTNSPIYLEIAKSAGRNVPPEVFTTIYTRADAIEALVGNETIVGKALQSGEDFLKKIDNDPDNDPTQTITKTTTETTTVSDAAHSAV